MNYASYSKFLIVILAAFVLTGCYVYHAPVTADNWLLDSVKTSSETIYLVVDEPYRTYVSHDRGHPLADPQTYYLGPALEKLTETYFSKSFQDVHILKDTVSLPDSISGFIVQPRVSKFKQQLTTSNRTFELSIAATVISSSGVNLGEVKGFAYTSHEVTPFGDAGKTEPALGRLIQDVLIQITNKVKEIVGQNSNHIKTL